MNRKKIEAATVEVCTGGTMAKPKWGGTGVIVDDTILTAAHCLTADWWRGERCTSKSLGNWALHMALGDHIFAIVRGKNGHPYPAIIRSVVLGADLAKLCHPDEEDSFVNTLGADELRFRRTRLPRRKYRFSSYLRESGRWVSGTAETGIERMEFSHIVCPWASVGGDSGSPLLDASGSVVGVLSQATKMGDESISVYPLAISDRI